MERRNYLGQKLLHSKDENEREKRTKKIIQKKEETEKDEESETEEVNSLPKNYHSKINNKKIEPLFFSLTKGEKEKQLFSLKYGEKAGKITKLEEKDSSGRFKNEESRRKKMDIYEEIGNLKNMIKDQEKRHKKELNNIQKINDQNYRAQEERYKKELNNIQKINDKNYSAQEGRYKKELNNIQKINDQNFRAQEKRYKKRLNDIYHIQEERYKKQLNDIQKINEQNYHVQEEIGLLKKEVKELKEFQFSVKIRKLLKNLLNYILDRFCPNYIKYDLKTKHIKFNTAPKCSTALVNIKDKDIIGALDRLLKLLFSKAKEKNYKVHFISKKALENKSFREDLVVFESSNDFFNHFYISNNDRNILKILIPEYYFKCIDN